MGLGFESFDDSTFDVWVGSASDVASDFSFCCNLVEDRLRFAWFSSSSSAMFLVDLALAFVFFAVDSSSIGDFLLFDTSP